MKYSVTLWSQVWSKKFIRQIAAVWSILTILRKVCAHELSEVSQLTAEPDFRAINLQWEYPKHQATNIYGFRVHYCELQAWGPNRCRVKFVESSYSTGKSTTNEAGTAPNKKYRKYSSLISGLRMSTNYSFEIRPAESKLDEENYKEYAKMITVPTRGFSAKANLCLPDVSEVEVSTGPYFGGRIAVESSDGATKCAIGGDANSSRDTYTLRIEHKTCGSRVNRTTVSTFIIVQETLPILTHSTRRFLVLCTFQPETLTVRAGINLPSTVSENRSHIEAEQQPGSGEITFTNEIIGNDDIQIASLIQSPDQGTGNQSRHYQGRGIFSRIVLVSFLMITAIIGICVTVWWLKPMKKIISARSRSSDSVFSVDTAPLSIYESFAKRAKETDPITEIDFGECVEDKLTQEESCKHGV